MASGGFLWWIVGYSFADGAYGNAFIGWDSSFVFTIPRGKGLDFLFGMVCENERKHRLEDD